MDKLAEYFSGLGTDIILGIFGIIGWVIKFITSTNRQISDLKHAIINLENQNELMRDKVNNVDEKADRILKALLDSKNK